MKTMWPAVISNNGDIEQQVGLLQKLFLSKYDEYVASMILAWLPMLIAIILFVCYLMNPGGAQLWIASSILMGISLLLFLLARWYYRRRKYLAFCAEGCAYADKLQAAPITLPWLQVTSIQLEEDSYLKVEENKVLGFRVSMTAQEASRNWLHIHSATESIRIKLSEFPERNAILEEALARSQERQIELGHERVVSSELAAARQGQGEASIGQTQYYAIGVVIIIILGIIRVVVKMNR